MQLIDNVAVGADSHRDGRKQTTRSNDDIKNILAIGAEALPTEPVEVHDDVHHIHDGDEEEEVVCKAASGNEVQTRGGKSGAHSENHQRSFAVRTFAS